MVADQPLDDVTLADRRRLPGRRGRRGAGRPRRGVRRAGPRASSCATSRAAGATTPARSTPPSWSGSCSTGQQARLTQAALETLAVVAYKQPVSRARVSAIRGVNVDGVMRTLLTRGLVEEAGTDHETGAHLYRTTGYFLERIGVTLARRAARAGAVPARPGRPRRRASDDRAPRRRRPRRRREATDDGVRRPQGPVTAERRDRRRRPGPAAEAAGPVGRGQPAQVRGADAGRPGRGRRRGGDPARHQGRPRARR